MARLFRSWTTHLFWWRWSLSHNLPSWCILAPLRSCAWIQNELIFFLNLSHWVFTDLLNCFFCNQSLLLLQICLLQIAYGPINLHMEISFESANNLENSLDRLFVCVRMIGHFLHVFVKSRWQFLITRLHIFFTLLYSFQQIVPISQNQT